MPIEHCRSKIADRRLPIEDWRLERCAIRFELIAEVPVRLANVGERPLPRSIHPQE